MKLTHSRHTSERRREFSAVVGKLSQPKPLLVFIVHVHRHDRDFITRRQFGQLIFHRLQNLGALEKAAGAVFAKIENQNQSEGLARLAFAMWPILTRFDRWSEPQQ